jgi:hypothetical protein
MRPFSPWPDHMGVSVTVGDWCMNEALQWRLQGLRMFCENTVNVMKIQTKFFLNSVDFVNIIVNIFSILWKFGQLLKILNFLKQYEIYMFCLWTVY